MLDRSTGCGYGADQRTARRPVSILAHRSCGCAQRWYVVATAPGYAYQVESMLSADGWRVFHPLHLTRITGHPSRIVSLFSNYLFVSFDISVDGYGDIRRTRHVRALLGPAERPAPVPSGVVEALQARTSARRIVDDPLSPGAWQNIPAGASVSVVDGPLASLRGVCLLSAQDRCRVLLSLLGRDCVMDLPAQSLQVA